MADVDANGAGPPEKTSVPPPVTSSTSDAGPAQKSPGDKKYEVIGNRSDGKGSKEKNAKGKKSAAGDKPGGPARQATVHMTSETTLMDLDDSHIPDGATAFEKQMHERIKAMDRDGDGKITIQELIDTVDEAAKDHHDKGFFKKLFFGTAAIVGALLLCIIGSTAAIAFLTSPIATEKGEDGQTVSFMASNDGSGTITQTLPASATLPLLAAPVLPKQMLRSVRQITVTLADPELGMKVEGTYIIDQLMWYNKTAVAFHTNSGGQIRIWNGEAHFFDKDGMKFSLCVSDVSCAAFKIDDATGQTKNSIMEEANTALEEAGFGDSNGARTLRRRRLQAGRIGERQLAEECSLVDDELALFVPSSPSPPSPFPPPSPLPPWGPDDYLQYVKDNSPSPPSPPSPPPSPQPPPPSPPPSVLLAITWGGAGSGGIAIDERHDGAIDVVANEFAFAAIQHDRTVKTWGLPDAGGEMSPGTESGLVGVRRIKATSKAFAAIKSDGSVIAWGDAAFGGDASYNSKSLDLRGTVALYSNDVAFVARKWDGTLQAWGPEGAGGKVPDYVSRFCPTGVSTVHQTKFAFFAECAPRPACSCRAAGTGEDQFRAVWGRHPENIDPAVQCPTYTTHQTCLQHETTAARSGFGYCEYSCPGLDLPEELEPDVYRGDVFRGNFVAEHTYYEDAFQAAGFGNTADDEKEELLRTLRLGVAWGDKLYGGTSWGGSALTHPADIVQVASTGSAFGAVLANGRVATWGSVTDGGMSPWAGKSDAELDDDDAISGGNCDPQGCVRLCATELYATDVAFAAKLDVCPDGRRGTQELTPLIAWPADKPGYPTIDDDKLTSISNAGGVKSVLANKGAFAVLTNNGNVYAWGSEYYGGKQDGPKITTATALQATEFAFSAVLADDTVQAWGDAKNGGNLDDATRDLLKTAEYGGVSKLYANHVAFAAVTNTGRVVTWGDQSNGGDSSSVTSDLVGVKYIEPSGSAFTAVVDSNSGLSVQEVETNTLQ